MVVLLCFYRFLTNAQVQACKEHGSSEALALKSYLKSYKAS